jgi:uncharacterized protein
VSGSPRPGKRELDHVLEVLRAAQPRAREVGAVLVSVVGSVARGDEGPQSDVDVVFDVQGRLDYWRLGGLSRELEAALGRPVDLVDREMMIPERWAWMSRDLVPL